MQTQNPFLDEFAKLTTAAMGIAQAAGEEAKTAMRSQADKWASELDLVRREDFDALKAELAALRAEVAALKAAPSATVATPKASKPASAPKTGGPAKATKKSE
jgi:BMFP domain-containing protein YqiC